MPSDQFPSSVSVSARVCALRPVPSLSVSLSPCLCPQTSSLPQCQSQPVSVPSDQFPPSVSVSARVYVLQVMKDKMGNTEVERRASYYEQPWCDEAVPRYFYAKVSHSLPQQLVSQEMNMGALRPPASCFCSLPITHTRTHTHTHTTCTHTHTHAHTHAHIHAPHAHTHAHAHTNTHTHTHTHTH